MANPASMDGEKQSLFGEIVQRLGEIRLTHGGKQLDGSQTLNEHGIPDGAMLHKHGRLRGGADVEGRSQKHKPLLWITMETPEGEEADYSMSEKNIKRSGTIHYECSMLGTGLTARRKSPTTSTKPSRPSSGAVTTISPVAKVNHPSFDLPFFPPRHPPILFDLLLLPFLTSVNVLYGNLYKPIHTTIFDKRNLTVP